MRSIPLAGLGWSSASYNAVVPQNYGVQSAENFKEEDKPDFEPREFSELRMEKASLVIDQTPLLQDIEAPVR